MTKRSARRLRRSKAALRRLDTARRFLTVMFG